jgi:hypothetical protein
MSKAVASGLPLKTVRLYAQGEPATVCHILHHNNTIASSAAADRNTVAGMLNLTDPYIVTTGFFLLSSANKI